MIRSIVPADTPRLVELSRSTGVFKQVEIDILKEILGDYHAGKAGGHVAVTYEREGSILGYVYYGVADMTDRTWYLHWIAVAPRAQVNGTGGSLLRHAEDDARARGARVLFIETSSLPVYDGARRFYEKHGYAVVGVLGDYYCDGDDMIVYRKRLAEPAAP